MSHHGLKGEFEVHQFAGEENIFSVGLEVTLVLGTPAADLPRNFGAHSHSKTVSSKVGSNKAVSTDAASVRENQKKFVIKSIRPKRQRWLVGFHGIDDRNQAEAWLKSLIYLPKGMFQSQPGEMVYLKELENFLVYDAQNVLRGKLVGFQSNGVQDLLVILNAAQRSFEVPFVDELILEINHQDKIIRMEIPEGLEEVNS